MKLAVVTVSIGPEYQSLGNLLNPSKAAYARKIGAEFIEITNRVFPLYHCNWEKLQVHSLLNSYDRLIFLDCDVLVRNDAPDLFELIPSTHFGVYDSTWWGGAEYPPDRWTDYRAPHYGVEPVKTEHYYNSGVMVVSAIHKDVFVPPPNMDIKEQPVDQPWINMQLVKLNIPVAELPYTMNRIHSVKFGKRTDSYIIHYNGMRVSCWLEKKYFNDPLSIIKSDIAELKSRNLLDD